MEQETLTKFEYDVKKVLLYYEIFNYPLKIEELFLLYSQRISFDKFISQLNEITLKNKIKNKNGFIFLKDEISINKRLEGEKRAIRLLKIAKVMSRIISWFPFVRGIFLTGEISKNISSIDGDIDFMIVTKENRVWVCRTFLILFKKLFLFNSKKYFCLNYFVSENHFKFKEQNMFFATEIVYLKPMYNLNLLFKYWNENEWIKNFYPNFEHTKITFPNTIERQSLVQRVFEFILLNFILNYLEKYFFAKTKKYFGKKYSNLGSDIVSKIFKSTPFESRAFVGNFEDKVLSLYNQKLSEHNIL